MFGVLLGMTMLVVMVVVNQRPTERLSEAVTNLDRLYLDAVHEYSEFALFAMTAWATGAPRWLTTGRIRTVLLRRRRKVGKMGRRSREIGRRTVGEIDGITVAIVVAIGGHGLNGMTKTNTIERRILFNRR